MVDHLTEEQIAEFKEAFSLRHEDGKETIKTKELGTILNSLGVGDNMSEDDLKNVINLFDADGKGTLNFNDFLTIMALTLEDDIEKEIRILFSIFDKDGNGFISRGEMQHIATYMGEKVSNKELDYALKEADKDHDGQINYQEFLKIMT